MGAVPDLADKARQLAQEAAVVLTQIVPARFASLRGEVFDPGHRIGGGDRHWFRDLGLGLLAGLVLGLFAAASLAGGGGAATVPPAPSGEGERERLLARRTELVGRREAAVARRVGELAARERELEARERGRAMTRPPESLPPPSQPVESLVQSVPTPAQPVRSVSGRPPGWTIDALETFVAAEADSNPDKANELRAYVFFLRDYADADGRIPPTFDALIEEVFEFASSPAN